jgi:hypothetical protein
VLIAIDLLAAFDNSLPRLKDRPQFLKSCADALGGSEAAVSARARFYGELGPEALGYYALTGSKLHKAASLVSLLTDLPPLWIFDLALNRHGTQPDDWMSSPAPLSGMPRLPASAIDEVMEEASSASAVRGRFTMRKMLFE